MELKTIEEFYQFIEEHEKACVLFSSTWCPPCKMLKPILLEFEENNSDKFIGIVNTDVVKGLAKEVLGIFNVPSLVFFKNKNQIKVVDGFISYEEIEEAFEEVNF